MSDYSYPISMTGGNSYVPLPSGEEYLISTLYSRVHADGVLALIITSTISCIAVVGLLVAVAISAFNTRTSGDKTMFVRTHVAAYFLSLLVGDLLQAVGSIMNARWYGQMAVHAGPFCAAQGAIKQASDVSAALWTLVIAIHTFCVLFMRMTLKRYVLWATLIGGWSTIFALVIFGPAALNTTKRGPFFGISGYWCWITPAYDTERLTLDYLMMFIAAIGSFILYTLVFLRLRGNIVVDGRHITFRMVNTKKSTSWRGREMAGQNQLLIIARQMLLYPVAYTILILPIAAARFSVFAGHTVPFGVTIFCDVIFLMSGLVNVILFTSTRRILPARSILGKYSIGQPKLIESSSSVVEVGGSDPFSNDPAYGEKSSATVPNTPSPPRPPRSPVSFMSEVPSQLSISTDLYVPPVQERQTQLLTPSSANRGHDSVFSIYNAYQRNSEAPPPMPAALRHDSQ